MLLNHFSSAKRKRHARYFSCLRTFVIIILTINIQFLSAAAAKKAHNRLSLNCAYKQYHILCARKMPAAHVREKFPSFHFLFQKIYEKDVTDRVAKNRAISVIYVCVRKPTRKAWLGNTYFHIWRSRFDAWPLPSCVRDLAITRKRATQKLKLPLQLPISYKLPLPYMIKSNVKFMFNMFQVSIRLK